VYFLPVFYTDLYWLLYNNNNRAEKLVNLLPLQDKKIMGIAIGSKKFPSNRPNHAPAFPLTRPLIFKWPPLNI
jgi:hypothetical protein